MAHHSGNLLIKTIANSPLPALASFNAVGS
jgi:hypothetical protein